MPTYVYQCINIVCYYKEEHQFSMDKVPEKIYSEHKRISEFGHESRRCSRNTLKRVPADFSFTIKDD